MKKMKLMTVLRRTKPEHRFSPQMGVLQTRVTYIKKVFMGIPFRTLHSYRETYYGEVKDCRDCLVSR